MRWILFILFCLLGAPAHAVSIPGVTTTTTTDSTTEPAPEPDIEQKKAAYGALADVLDNDMWGSDQFWAEFVQPGRACKPCVARGMVI